MSDLGESASVEGTEPSLGTAPRWRQLDSYLWVGRADDRPAGTIERDRGFVFVDLDGDRYGGYRTLEDAQKAATAPVRAAGPQRRGRSKRLSVVGHVVAVVVVVSVLVVFWTVLKYQIFG